MLYVFLSVIYNHLFFFFNSQYKYQPKKHLFHLNANINIAYIYPCCTVHVNVYSCINPLRILGPLASPH